MVNAKGSSVKTSVGIAIDLYSAADNVVIDNCVFNNWYNVGVSINSANNAIVQNSQFYGGSATYINNIPDGPKDRGTYHVSVMGSSGTQVLNCLFAGTVCDGVSVAGSSFNSLIAGNEFIDNAFSIYFGGKSTEGTLIENNTFTNCGWFESPIYDENGDTGKNVSFYDLPVISVQKSSDSFIINNNTFYARNANTLIKALEGSTAHGGASNIGNITITDNTVIGLDQTPLGDEKIIMPSVTLVAIETYNDVIRPTGEIIIAGNTLNGARSASYWTTKWGDNQGDVSIKAAQNPTVILVTSVKDETIIGLLKDCDDAVLGGENITYSAEGNSGSVETDYNGIFIIKNVTGLVTMDFAGAEKYLATESSIDVPVSSSTFTLIDIASLKDETIKGSLKDIYGQGLAGQSISYVSEDANGTVETAADGSFTISDVVGEVALTFTKSGKYVGSTANVEVAPIATQEPTVLVYPSIRTYTFKDAEVKATFTSNDKPLVNQSVRLVINGNHYVGTTDENGTYSVTVSYSNYGIYTMAAYYAGNATQAAAFSSTKILVYKSSVTLETPDYTFYKNGAKRVIVYLKDENGKPVVGKYLTLKLANGVTVNAKTLSNGGALFNVPISNTGTYNYGVYWYGDNSYNSKYSAGKIVVK